MNRLSRAEALPFVGVLLLGSALLVHTPRVPESEPIPLPSIDVPRLPSAPPDEGRRVVPEAEPRKPELLTGFWHEETWPDGSTGRWTSEDASVRLERRAGENDLLVDIAFSHPTNLTTGFIEVNGRRLVRIRNANGRRRMVLPIGSIPDRVLVVRFVAERPFVGREQGPARGDPRRLGFFVREVRLLPAP
jgi:hypothetical protein